MSQSCSSLLLTISCGPNPSITSHPFPSWHIVQASKEPRTGAAPPVTKLGRNMYRDMWGWGQGRGSQTQKFMASMFMTCRTIRFRINLLLRHGACELYLVVRVYGPAIVINDGLYTVGQTSMSACRPPCMSAQGTCETLLLGVLRGP